MEFGEMAQQLQTLAALPEDSSLIPKNSHHPQGSSQPSGNPAPGDLMPFFGLCGYSTYLAPDIHAGKILILIKINKLIF